MIRPAIALTTLIVCATTHGQVVAESAMGPKPRQVEPRAFFPQIDEAVMTPKLSSKHEFTPVIESIPGAESMEVGRETLLPESLMQPRISAPGIGYSLAKPPDPELAVGNRWVVQVVNTKIAYFEKLTLRKTFERSLAHFFKMADSPTRRLSDPRIAYDKLSKRWFLAFLSVDFSKQESKLHLGVSKDSDPNLGWFLYDFNAKFSQDGISWWVDFPTMGFNRDALVLSGNAFDFPGTRSLGSRILSIRKSALLTGAAPTIGAFTEKSAFSIQWVRASDANFAPLYGVCARFTTALQVYALTNLNATPVLNKLLEPPAKNPQTLAVPSMVPASPALGPAGRRVDSLDTRLMTANWRDGSVWISQGVRQSPTDTRSHMRWYEVKTKGWPTSGQLPGIAQKGTVTGAGGQWLFIPMIAQNRDGDVAMVGTRMSSSTVGDLVTMVRKSSDVPGAMSAPSFRYSSSGAFYGNSTSSSDPARWGDYFGIVVDPIDETTFWITGMVGNQASGDANAWKTYIFSLNVRSPKSSTVDLFSISKVFGGSVTGSLASAQTSNNAHFKVRTAGTPTKSTIATTFRLTGDRSRIRTLEAVLEVAGSTGADVQVQVLNRTRGVYEDLGSDVLTSLDRTLKFSFERFFADYFSPAGDIRFHVTATSTLGAPFDFKLDLAQLRVTKV